MNFRVERKTNAHTVAASGSGDPVCFFRLYSVSPQTVDGRNLATVRTVHPLASPAFDIGAPQGPRPSKIQIKQEIHSLSNIKCGGCKGGQ